MLEDVVEGVGRVLFELVGEVLRYLIEAWSTLRWRRRLTYLLIALLILLIIVGFAYKGRCLNLMND